MKRKKRTKIAQKLPDDLDDKIVNFHSHVIKMRKRHDYPLHLIGNMDETPMQFDMPGNRTVYARCEKTVFVKTTGHEKTHFTLVLCCMADGTKLKPMVIFKRKTMPKEKFPSGVLVHVHEKGWMDEAGTKKWLDEVWGRRKWCPEKKWKKYVGLGLFQRPPRRFSEASNQSPQHWYGRNSRRPHKCFAAIGCFIEQTWFLQRLDDERRKVLYERRKYASGNLTNTVWVDCQSMGRAGRQHNREVV